jgi:hypothetical protein
MKPRLREVRRLSRSCSVGLKGSGQDSHADSLAAGLGGFPTEPLEDSICVLARSHLPPPGLPIAADAKTCLRVSGWFSSSNLAQALILFVGTIPSAEVAELLAAQGI